MRQNYVIQAIVSYRKTYCDDLKAHGAFSFPRDAPLSTKQTKVARQLKYNTPTMDLDSLQRELAGKAAPKRAEAESHQDDEYDEYADAYSQYADWIKEQESKS